MATVEQKEQANIDKQIAKELMIAHMNRTNVNIFDPSNKEEYQFEAIWSRIFNAVSSSG